VLNQADTDVLFPPRVVATLRWLRGEEWQALVGHILRCPENDPDLLAFGLLMIRLGGCLSCHADSYRALRGCTLCAQQSVLRFKGSDADLIGQWEIARADVLHWMRTGQPPFMD
jgi:hypothetical protein